MAFAFPIEQLPFEAFLIIAGLASTLIATKIVQWWRTRSQKQEKNADDVQDLRKAVWRLNKTVVIMAKILDGMSKKTHPELESELEEIARELLSTTNDYDEDA